MDEGEGGYTIPAEEYIEGCIGWAQQTAVEVRSLGDPHLDALFDQNPDNVYYRFLFHLARIQKPALMVELGVCEGRSTAHMAAGHPEGKVIAVDPEVHGALQGNCLDRYDNVDFRQCRSDDEHLLASVGDRTVGLLFVDSIHTLPHVLTELRLWLPKMRPLAPIIFDDLDYFWSMAYLLDILPLQHKGRLEGLHLHGFGYALAEPDLRLRTKRTGAQELTVTWWRGDGERQSRTTPG